MTHETATPGEGGGTGSKTTDTPRIYAACLAAYNNGHLHGRWIDATQDPETVRLTIALQAELHERLELYAQVYSETYDEPVDLKRLLPHILERFLTSDRGFQRRVAKPLRQEQTKPSDHSHTEKNND